MVFDDELLFEKDVLNLLLENGWNEILKNKTEKDLIQNWADILFKNNGKRCIFMRFYHCILHNRTV